MLTVFHSLTGKARKDAYRNPMSFLVIDSIIGRKSIYIPSDLNDLMLVCFNQPVDGDLLHYADQAKRGEIKWSELGLYRNVLRIGDPQAHAIHTKTRFSFVADKIYATFQFSNVNTSATLVPKTVRVSVNEVKPMIELLEVAITAQRILPRRSTYYSSPSHSIIQLFALYRLHRIFRCRFERLKTNRQQRNAQTDTRHHDKQPPGDICPVSIIG